MRRHLLKVWVLVAATAAAVATAEEAGEERARSNTEEEGRNASLAERVSVLEEAVSRLSAAADGGGMDLGSRVTALEQDSAMFAILNSRLRALESEQRVVNEEMTNLRRNVRRWKREVEALRREVQQPEALTGMKVDPACCLSLNESIMEAEERERGVNASLSDLRYQLQNLSNDLQDLQESAPHQPLLLCPTPYTKVGDQCFYLYEKKLWWRDARTACKERGVAMGGNGDLAIPTDLPVFRVYVESLQAGTEYLWLGGVRENGTWKWVSEYEGDGDWYSLREGNWQDLRVAPWGREEPDNDPDHLGLPWDIGEPDNEDDQPFLCIHSRGSIKFHDCLYNADIPALCELT